MTLIQFLKTYKSSATWDALEELRFTAGADSYSTGAVGDCALLGSQQVARTRPPASQKLLDIFM